jgi:hypothetical protein
MHSAAGAPLRLRVERLKPRVWPICDLQIRKVVGATGFEPATPCAQERGLAMSRDVMRKDDRSQVL